MRDQVLVKQFKDDAGVAFLEVIKRARRPVRLKEIRSDLVEAGADRREVDRGWARLREHIKAHPNVTSPKTGVYDWSLNAHSTHDSLEKLAEQARKRAPGRSWLVGAYADNIADSLAQAETAGPRSQLSWTEQREREKATLVAEIVGSVELLVSDGGAVDDVLERLAQEARDHKLSRIGQIGDELGFDGDVHEPAGRDKPRAGQSVRVLRSGFSWSGASPNRVVVVKALVSES